jgi:hypothetical protein
LSIRRRYWNHDSPIFWVCDQMGGTFPFRTEKLKVHRNQLDSKWSLLTATVYSNT